MPKFESWWGHHVAIPKRRFRNPFPAHQKSRHRLSDIFPANRHKVSDGHNLCDPRNIFSCNSKTSLPPLWGIHQSHCDTIRTFCIIACTDTLKRTFERFTQSFFDILLERTRASRRFRASGSGSSDRVLDRVLQLRLVEVDGHVDLLGADHLRQAIGRALDQQAVGPPRPAPVQVADVSPPGACACRAGPGPPRGCSRS